MLRLTKLVPILAVIGLLVAIEQNSLAVAPRLDVKTIKAGLRTVKIEEDGFVDEVVDMARKGELPWAIVDNAFSWARKKPKNKFQYFKRALIKLAARKGITVPRPPKPVATPKKSAFFIQKLKDFYATLKGVSAKLPLIGNK